MYAKLYGATLHGIDGCIITVEVDISQGLPVFDIVGPLKIVDTNFQ